MKLKEALLTVLEQKPCIRAALYSGLINYSALALNLKPEIEEMLKRNVSAGSIMLALRDLKVKGEENTLIREAILSSFYSVESGLKDYVIDWSAEDLHTLFALLSKKKTTVSIIVGKKYTSLITHRDIEDFLREANITIIKKIPNVANFRIVIKEEYFEVSGIIETILRGFMLNNISIIEMNSSFTEIGILIKEEDVIKAINTLKDLKNRLSKRNHY